jgi:hypothetical protein
MGYSLTKHSVLRSLPQLKQLAKTRATLSFNTDDPKKFAYRLREAIAASGAHEEFAELYEINQHYKFKEENGKVTAMYFDMGALGEPIGESEVATATRTKKEIPGVFDFMEVLATCLKNVNEHELYFPDAKLCSDEKYKLYMWCEPLDWTYIDHSHGGGTGLTLTKDEIPEGIAWTPEERGRLS